MSGLPNNNPFGIANERFTTSLTLVATKNQWRCKNFARVHIWLQMPTNGKKG
jgi:hypothetical protein